MWAGLLVEDEDLVLDGRSHKCCILLPPLQTQAARCQALSLRDPRWQARFHIGLTEEKILSSALSVHSFQLHQRKTLTCISTGSETSWRSWRQIECWGGVAPRKSYTFSHGCLLLEPEQTLQRHTGLFWWAAPVLPAAATQPKPGTPSPPEQEAEFQKGKVGKNVMAKYSSVGFHLYIFFPFNKVFWYIIGWLLWHYSTGLPN